MTQLISLVAIALLLMASATSANAQPAFSQPDAFQAEYPNRDVLNGGALTPAGRMGLERPDGAAGSHPAQDAHAQISNVPTEGTGSNSCAQRYHSYNPATGTILGHDGRRHPCR
jgi:hypothetical protein